ncbi:methyl-viologen-reducing hydrogenase subunit delta [candidate division MSBL1 archaeon SCGC-AAA259B11]|uniref:Methyl-viologen-reducing hydrogenase subunit delta n=1 Tax=candidate division MSBL1 archaeon SCGC-AAA259B11 TaxID=1698260 RepID=A0A133U5N5_9EURY|nr:methyl-viologen-reducing hydrogenase subunit delta [candidate division MSBL1 archaeon SCGC-AAA259B11]
MEDSKPRIVGILCRWCTYQAADTAGTSLMKYPPNLTPIRVQCSGRVDPTFVLKAFKYGADGVFIGGCHPGECHYEEGNYNTMKRVPLLKRMLEQFGIDRDRVRLEWISAAEPNKFANTVTEFTEKIKELGPLDWKKVEI